jgi:hypothetical protein
LYYGSICLIYGFFLKIIITYLFVGLASMLRVMHTTIKSWGRCEQHWGKKIFKSNKHGHRVTWENGMSFCKM